MVGLGNGLRPLPQFASRFLLGLILGSRLRSLSGNHETSRKSSIGQASLRLYRKLLRQDRFNVFLFLAGKTRRKLSHRACPGLEEHRLCLILDTVLCQQVAQVRRAFR